MVVKTFKNYIAGAYVKILCCNRVKNVCFTQFIINLILYSSQCISYAGFQVNMVYHIIDIYIEGGMYPAQNVVSFIKITYKTSPKYNCAQTKIITI